VSGRPKGQGRGSKGQPWLFGGRGRLKRWLARGRAGGKRELDGIMGLGVRDGKKALAQNVGRIRVVIGWGALLNTGGRWGGEVRRYF